MTRIVEIHSSNIEKKEISHFPIHRKDTSELSPPKAGSPHVTTLSSDLMAAKAPSLGTTCWTSTSPRGLWLRRPPHVTTVPSSLMAVKAASVARICRTPLRSLALKNNLNVMGRIKQKKIDWTKCERSGQRVNQKIKKPSNNPEIKSHGHVEIKWKTCFSNWPSSSSKWPVASPPASADPQTTALPSALMAAKAPSLAETCTTSWSSSWTRLLSPPVLGAPSRARVLHVSVTGKQTLMLLIIFESHLLSLWHET